MLITLLIFNLMVFAVVILIGLPRFMAAKRASAKRRGAAWLNAYLEASLAQDSQVPGEDLLQSIRGRLLEIEFDPRDDEPGDHDERNNKRK